MNSSDDLEDQKELARELVYLVNGKYMDMGYIDKTLVLLSLAMVNCAKGPYNKEVWDTLCQDCWQYHEKYLGENNVPR